VDKPKKCSLNIREFPADLRWKCKAIASDKKMKLADWVIQVLTEAVKKPTK
jgi:hypothetical protein